MTASRTSAALLALLTGCNAEWVPAEGEVEALANKAPELSLAGPGDGAEVTTNQTLTVSGSVSDDDALSDLTLSIRSDRDGDLTAPALDEDGFFSQGLSLSEGEHTLTVTVIDLGQLSASASVGVTVVANTAPPAPTVSISPANPGTADTLVASISSVSVDPDGDEVSYSWRWTVNGEDAGVSGDTVEASLTADDQDWAVYVAATDGDLSSEEATATVFVNDGPDVEVSISPEEPGAGDSLSCSWTATDPDGGSVSVDAAWLVEGAVVGDGANNLSDAFSKGEEVTCEVTATADSGDTVRSASVVVVNTAPVVESVTLSPTSGVTKESTLTCSATASDLDGDGFRFTYTWLINGAGVTDGETLGGVWFNRGDSVTCSAVADDDEDVSASVNADVTVTVENSPPTAPTVELSADEVSPGVELECLVVTAGSDADGDSLSYTFRWTADGETLSETGEVLETGSLVGAEVTCAASASDGYDASAYSAAATATVLGGLSGDYPADDADLIISGTENGGGLSKVDLVGDVDGDGVQEVLLGAPSASDDDGEIFLFSGADLTGDLTDSDASWSWIGDTDDNLGGGSALAGVADLGTDGRAEVLVGAYKASVGPSESGAVYLLRSEDRSSWSGDIEADAAAVIYGETASDYCGISADAGDLDGDGDDDIFVGCYGYDTGVDNGGGAAVFTGAASLGDPVAMSDADYLLTGDARNDLLGWQGSEITGDLNGDGYSDLALGAYQMDGASADTVGVALLVSGDDLGSDVASAVSFARLEGTVNSARFAYDIAGVADVDGDTRDDLFVSAYREDGGGTESGVLYFWYGDSLSGTLSADEADLSWDGVVGYDNLGQFLASGDVTGDGLGDLLAAAPNADEGDTNSGAVYLLSGELHDSWTGDIEADAQVIFTGLGNTDQLGYGMAAGDRDGDGYGEVYLGARYYDTTTGNAGAVFIFSWL